MNYFKAIMKWLFLLAVFTGTVNVLSWEAAVQRVEQRLSSFDPAIYKAMEWRCIGPYRGGRVTAVAGITDQTLVYYFGATGGGIW